MGYRVFISYRREGGDDMARLIYERLKQDGYEPFFDVEQMRSGKFNDQLYARIAECEDFVLVLPPHGLERCVAKDDWVRLEIQEALRLKKNIIPFMMRNFEFPAELPSDISEIRDYQGVAASQDYFDSAYDRLKSLISYRPKTQKQQPKRNVLPVLILCIALLATGIFAGVLWAQRDGASSNEGVQPTAAVTEGEAQPEATAEMYYIGNKSRMRFHYPDCKSVADMKEKNRVILMSREEAIEKGYKSCGECHP